MDDLIEQLTAFLSDLPIGLIVFVAVLLFSFFTGNRNDPADIPDRRPRQDEAPRPVFPSDDPYATRSKERPSTNGGDERPSDGYTFASDERREREERERREQEVLVFGGMDFGRQGSLFDEEENRDSQWGRTKYGFDESEWGSDNQWGGNFDEKKDSEPVIR